MTYSLHPIGARIVLRPKTVRDHQNDFICNVVAVGPDASADLVGRDVLVGRYAGHECHLTGELIAHEVDILAVIYATASGPRGVFIPEPKSPLPVIK